MMPDEINGKGVLLMTNAPTYAKAQSKLVTFSFADSSVLDQYLSDGWQVLGFSTYGTEQAIALLAKYQLAAK